MTTNQAQKLMRLAAAFCPLAPGLIFSGFALQGIFAEKPSTFGNLRIAITAIGALIVLFNILKFSIPLWRYRKPESFKNALVCGCSILCFVPSVFNANELAPLWFPLWIIAMQLIFTMADLIQPALIKALESATPSSATLR